MDSALPLLLFLGFLFGSALLILVFGWRDLAARFNEDDDAEPRPLQAAAERPRFFVDLGGGLDAPMPMTSWATPWGSVEAHLRHEHEMASSFVAAPSLQMLFAHSNSGRTSYVEQLEKHVQQETRLVNDMIHRYPARSLYPHTPKVTFVPQPHAPAAGDARLGLQVRSWTDDLPGGGAR